MKKCISVLLMSVLTLLIISSSVFSNSDLKPIPNFSRDRVTKKALIQKEPNTVQIKLGDPDSSTDVIEKPEKIRSRLQERINNINTADEVIEVQVALDYNADITVDKFADTFKNLFGDLPVEKDGAFHFLTSLTTEQIQQLIQLPDVIYVDLPGTMKPIEKPVEIEITEGDIGILVNASTEMTGAKKARADFKVTGDRDGNETRYSKNDITIAILDTGIDTSHVDLDGGKVIGCTEQFRMIFGLIEDGKKAGLAP